MHQHRTTPTPASPDLNPAPKPKPNLFLHAGWWQAACPTCGYVLVEAHRQDQCERKARSAACPVCQEVA